MKIIIDIPEEEYNNIEPFLNGETIKGGFNLFKALEIIKNGTPLDDIKAEIKEWYWQADKQALAKDPCVVDAMVDLFIRTIEQKEEVSE